MASIIDIDGLSLRLHAHFFGARARGRAVADAWTIDLEDGTGVGIFLLGDDDEDGAFLARFDGGDTWSTEFYDADWNQLALRDRQGRYEVLLKLEFPGAPIPAEGSVPGDEDHLEVAPGPALWVTVRELGEGDAS
jgi:hypothetical protein